MTPAPDFASPPLPASPEDESRLRVLGVLHYALGGIIGVFALLPCFTSASA